MVLSLCRAFRVFSTSMVFTKLIICSVSAKIDINQMSETFEGDYKEISSSVLWEKRPFDEHKN